MNRGRAGRAKRSRKNFVSSRTTNSPGENTEAVTDSAVGILPDESPVNNSGNEGSKTEIETSIDDILGGFEGDDKDQKVVEEQAGNDNANEKELCDGDGGAKANAPAAEEIVFDDLLAQTNEHEDDNPQGVEDQLAEDDEANQSDNKDDSDKGENDNLANQSATENNKEAAVQNNANVENSEEGSMEDDDQQDDDPTHMDDEDNQIEAKGENEDFLDDGEEDELEEEATDEVNNELVGTAGNDRVDNKEEAMTTEDVSNVETASLPNGWSEVTHACGITLFYHEESSLITFSKPYKVDIPHPDDIKIVSLSKDNFPSLPDCLKFHRLFSSDSNDSDVTREKRRKMNTGEARVSTVATDATKARKHKQSVEHATTGSVMDRIRKIRETMTKEKKQPSTDDVKQEQVEVKEEEKSAAEDVSADKPTLCAEDKCFYGDKADEKDFTIVNATMEDEPFIESNASIAAPNKMLHDALRSKYGFAPLCLMQGLDSIQKLGHLKDRFMTIGAMETDKTLKEMTVVASGIKVVVPSVPSNSFHKARKVACCTMLKQLYPDVVFYEEFKDIGANWERSCADDRLPNVKLHQLLISKYGSSPSMLLASDPDISPWEEEGKVWNFINNKEFSLHLHGADVCVTVKTKKAGRLKASELMYEKLLNTPVPQHIKDKLNQKDGKYGSPINPKSGEVAESAIFRNFPDKFTLDTPAPHVLLHRLLNKRYGTASEMLLADDQTTMEAALKKWADRPSVWNYDTRAKQFSLTIQGKTMIHHGSDLAVCRRRCCELMLQQHFKAIKDYSQLARVVGDLKRKMPSTATNTAVKKPVTPTAQPPKKSLTPKTAPVTSNKNPSSASQGVRDMAMESDKLMALLDSDVTLRSPLEILKEYIAFDLTQRKISYDDNEAFVESTRDDQLITVKTKFVVTKLKKEKNSRAQGRISVKKPPSERMGKMKAAQCMLKALFGEVGLDTYGKVSDFVRDLKQGVRREEYFKAPSTVKSA